MDEIDQAVIAYMERSLANQDGLLTALGEIIPKNIDERLRIQHVAKVIAEKRVDLAKNYQDYKAACAG